MVGTARFELATPCTPSKCATRLRYVPTESAAPDDGDSGGLTSKFYTRRQPRARARSRIDGILRGQGLTSITNERDEYHHGATASCGNMINIQKSELWNYVRFFSGDSGIG